MIQWAITQQQEKKNYIAGSKTTMTNTKLQHLDDLGFEWRSYDGRWYGEEMGCNPPKFGFHWT